jgi:GNAT superfamily N-acetyltransferase
MTFELRVARPEDAEVACAVLRRSITECCPADHRNDPAILSAWLANKTPETVRSWFCSSAHGIVAERGTQVVGVAMLNGSSMVTLNYLIPEARFLGMGKAMLEALEAEAVRRGGTELSLYSTATAHEFYARNGYRDTGRTSSMFGLSSREMSKTLAPIAPPGQSGESPRNRGRLDDGP